MRMITLICRKCGHRRRVEFYDTEEAIRHRIPAVPLNRCCCERCGSFDLEVN